MPQELPGPINSEHWAKSKTADGHWLFQYTGIQPCSIKGTGVQWKWEAVQFAVPLRAVEPGFGLDLSYWTVLVTPSWISNEQIAEYAGWAVNDIELANPRVTQESDLQVDCQVGVRDSDGFVNGLYYTISLVADEVRLRIVK